MAEQLRCAPVVMPEYCCVPWGTLPVIMPAHRAIMDSAADPLLDETAIAQLSAQLLSSV